MTTDGHKVYLDAVEDAFGSGIDHAMLIKVHGPTQEEKRYSPAEFIGCELRRIKGNPDPKHISKSFVERQNPTMRMNMRRFTRLTNGFSKKSENLMHAVSLHFFYFIFVRIHQTLRVTPAMEAGLMESPMEIRDIALLSEQNSK